MTNSSDPDDIIERLRVECRRQESAVSIPHLRTILRRAERRRRAARATKAAAIGLVAAVVPVAALGVADRLGGERSPSAGRESVGDTVATSPPVAGRDPGGAPGSDPRPSPRSSRTDDRPSSTPTAVPTSVDPARPSSTNPGATSSAPAATRSIDVVFRIATLTDKGCRKTERVSRRIPESATAEDPVRAVLAGPTAAERSAGVRSAFGLGGRPTRASVAVLESDRVVVVDFASRQALERPPGCGGGEIIYPLEKALEQWRPGWQVKCRIGGSTATFQDYLDSFE
ncbi:MAG: hypothetical protein ACRCYQ_08230 [Nocardioides sp.]